MKMKFALPLLLLVGAPVLAQVPGIVTYQGRITSNGTNFTGTGGFRFALIRPGPPVVSLWSHDNSSAAGSMPGTQLSLGVTNGLFTVPLGDTSVAGMLSAVPASAFTNADVRLRIWFDDGVSGVAQLTPDQRISSAAYALMGANVPDGAITTAKLADGAVTGTKIAGATVATANLAANSVNTTHIIDGQVQTADLANDSVNSSKVVNGSLVGGDLADNTVTSQQLADTIVLGATNVNGRLEVYRTTTGTPAITLDGSGNQISTFGDDGLEQIRLWGPSYGELLLYNSLPNNATAVRLTAQGSTGGMLALNNTNGTTRALLEGENAGGALTLYQADGNTGAILYGNEGAGSGALSLRNTNGSARFRAYGGPGAGSMDVLDADGTLTFNVDAAEGATEGAQLNMYQGNGARTVQLDAEAGANGGGYLGLYEGDGTETVTATANGNGALTLRQGDSSTGVWLGANNGTGGGGISIYRDSGTFAGQFTIADATRQDAFLGLTKGNGNWGITMRGQNSSTGGGAIYLYDSAGTATIVMDADSVNEGRIWTQVLTITGGSDLSESFNINAADTFEPGMVVCIDPAKPGELALSREPYDPTVAGIISGAGGVKTGMLMSQAGSKADGKHPVALTGRVYCYVDADAAGAIKPGDMLTTSATPGHAMKVTDRDRAFGSVIGKAMTGLPSGKGLVLVLVSLQ